MAYNFEFIREFYHCLFFLQESSIHSNRLCNHTLCSQTKTSKPLVFHVQMRRNQLLKSLGQEIY